MKISLPNIRGKLGKLGKAGGATASSGSKSLKLPFKLPVSRTPISMHFGSLDTRILQMDGGPGHWRVTASEVLAAQGKGRHTAVAEDLVHRLDELGFRGKDCAVALSGKDVAISRVPLDQHNRARMAQVLKETAARAVQDPEGILYRYLPLNGDEVDDVEGSNVREEYLLMSVGQSEMRRCSAAINTLQWRQVSLEAGAFPLARALQAVQHGDESDAWGFMHLGYGHSMFGIVHNGEIGFLKPMQLDGERLMNTLENTLSGFEGPSADALTDLIAGGGEEEDAGRPAIDTTTVMTMNQRAIGHATELMQSLRMEAQTLAQEVRACVRHFANRHHGARLSSVYLTGFGAGLPEVENAVGNALDVPTSVARPFTALGIDAPEHVLEDEHMWCTALGLAMRGYE